MDQKTISWVSYLTIIGWIIALVSYNSSVDKSALARFHLRQSLGLFLTGFAIYIVEIMLLFVIGFAAFLFQLLFIVLFVFWIIGLVAAVNGEMKPLPVVGDIYQRSLTFIN